MKTVIGFFMSSNEIELPGDQ